MAATKKLKCIVKQDFIDKYTGIMHKAGTEVSLTEERYREIKGKGNFVQIAVKTVVKTKEK